MKRIAFIVALLSSSLWAQTTTTITGTIKDLTNVAVTSGKVTFTLTPNRDTTISGIARFTPTTVTCLINGSGLIKAQDGVSTCTLTMNTALSPSGTYYTVAVWPYNVKTASFTFYAVLNTYDWSTVVPTPATSPAQNYVDVFSNQTIGGNKTFSGAETFTGATTIGLLNNVIYASPGESLATALAQLGGAPGTIVFAPGTYPSGGAVINTAGVMILGSGIPNYNSATAPTAMTGGTIINGTVVVTQGGDHFVIKDLGIDVGPTWVNAFNGGVAVDALSIANLGQVVGAPPVQSPIIENVACLGYSLNAAVHCMLVENVNAAKINNVKTVFNQHGLIIKGTNVDASNIWSRGHGTDSIIVLSNNYAPSNSVTIKGFHISDLATPGDTKGIFLQAAQNPLSYVNISDGDVTGFLSWGIATSGASAPAAVTQVSISNVTMDGFTGNASALYCIDFQGFTNLVNIVNLSCANTAQGIIPVGVSGFNDVKVVGSQFVNIAGIGVELSGRSTVTGSHFTSVAGNAIQNDSGTLSECNDTFASVGAALSGSGFFSCGIATEDTNRNVAFPTGVLSTTYLGPGKAAIASFPACASGIEGSHMVATNCNAGCVAGNACAAGGTTHCEMYCSSSPAWVETGR